MDSDAKENPEALGGSDVVELLSDIEGRLAAAWVAGDSSFHERVLADDWSVIDLTGRVLSKSDVLGGGFLGRPADYLGPHRRD